MKILCLGDSITVGAHVDGYIPGGYRSRLAARLHDAGVSATFVGRQFLNPGLDDPDSRHEGYSGYCIVGDEVRLGLFEMLDDIYENPVDLTLLMIGVNDLYGGVEPVAVAERLGRLLEGIFQRNPSGKIVLGSLIGATDKALDRRCAETNALYQAMAEKDARIAWCDLFGLDRKKDFWDPVHPNEVGLEKMADAWAATVLAGL